MKKVKEFMEWTTTKEKICLIVMVLSSIISLIVIGKIVDVLYRAWTDLNGLAIGWLIFLALTQEATFFYAVFTSAKFIKEKLWCIKMASLVCEYVRLKKGS